MKNFITLNQVEQTYPVTRGTYTPEQQLEVAKAVVSYQHPNFEDKNNKTINVIATEQDTLPYIWVKVPGTDSTYAKRPAPGWFWIYPAKENPFMGFKAYDYNKDGILDAGLIILTFMNGILPFGPTHTEVNSYFVIGPVTLEKMKRKTIFHERGGFFNPDDSLAVSPADDKLIYLVQMLHSDEALRYKDGKLYIGFKPKAPLSEVLSLEPPPGFKLENGLYVPNR